VLSRGTAPATQLELPLDTRGEGPTGAPGQATPVEGDGLMEHVVERTNLLAALARVKRNGGSPGTDGMTVEELPGYLKAHWPEIREALLAGRYQPQPVKRVEMPKPGGGVRKLGIPTVLDRFIQQALLQVLQPAWDGPFSDGSYGFRPGRSAHHAIAKAQQYLRAGYSWVVDPDLEKFFDRVNHDKLMSRVKERVTDRRVLPLIDRYLKAGALTGDGFEATPEGTPQGGPRTPPTILQTFFFRARIARAWINPEHHLHLIMGHLHALNQRADHLPFSTPIGLNQSRLDLYRKVFQPPNDQAQVGVQGVLLDELWALRCHVGNPLAESSDPGLELRLLNKPLAVTVEQPRQPLPPLAQLRFERGEGRALSVSVGMHPPLVFFCQPPGVGQQRTAFLPHGPIQQIRADLSILADPFAPKAVGVSAQAPVIGIRPGSALRALGLRRFPSYA
jgi:Reverse transcriptase (RNA-dependent DNA polymerase)